MNKKINLKYFGEKSRHYFFFFLMKRQIIATLFQIEGTLASKAGGFKIKLKNDP